MSSSQTTSRRTSSCRGIRAAPARTNRRRSVDASGSERAFAGEPSGSFPSTSALVLFLAEQDAQGVTGQVINALQWNVEHGFGGVDRWGFPPDFEGANR